LTTRQSRKIDHLRHTLELADGPVATGFADLTLLHNCLPELRLDDVSLATDCAGMRLTHPVVINAMTGGALALTEVNARLAELAARTGSVMAVGSQYAAVKQPEVADSFRVVRQVNPSGLIWANIGAYATVAEARQVVEMIEANALQIHLNAAQEISMPEGDVDFTGWLRRIEQIVKELPVPVIVKETGCGMALEQIRLLASIGVAGIDVGGAGGTNFIAIENSRTNSDPSSELLQWGIPAAISALEAMEVLPPTVDLIVSGGIRSPLDALKSFAVGASAVGIATPILRKTEQSGVDAAVKWLENYLTLLRKTLLLLGRKDLRDLRGHPLVIGGFVAQWLEARGISTRKYARRHQAEERGPCHREL
jgi:isopentenyl-diphosphate delta-isomerase